MCEKIFTGLACAAAFVSGALWLRSALVQVPALTYPSIEPDGTFLRALAKQATLNKWAAGAPRLRPCFRRYRQPDPR